MERKIDLKSNGIMPEQIVYDTHTNSLQLNYAPPVEFKIGDKVRLKKNLNFKVGEQYNGMSYLKSMDDVKDAILTIDRIYESEGSLKGYNNIDGNWWLYRPEWLEHVVENPGPKFKIGDKVIVKNIKGGSRSISENIFVSTMREFIGNTYTINHVFDDGDVRLEGCGSYIFAEEWLETPLENSKRMYKVGDILQCIDHPAVFILGDFPEFPEDGYSAIAGLTASGKLIFNTDYVWGNLDTVRLATYNERKVLVNALAKEGKEFNSDTLEIEDIKPEFKRGDILAYGDILLIFDEYANKERNKLHSLWNNFVKDNRNWISKYFTYATDEQKAQVHRLLKKEGKKWNEEALEIEDLVDEFKRGDILTAMKATPDGKDITFVYDEYIIPDKGRGYFKLLCGGVYYHPFEKIKELRNIELKFGFNINNVKYANYREIEKFDNDLKEIGKKWNRETLQLEDLDINEIVYSVSTACSYLNKPVPDFTSLLLTISNEDFHKYKAQITLQFIREAWNKFDGFEADFEDSGQSKYYPIINLFTGNIEVGGGCVSAAVNSACYSFATTKRAIQFGTQFKELFKTAMGNDF